MKKQAGFTLIELIMVIVILGILSAFALPRFADLSSDAEDASLQGVIASMKSASGIAHAQQLADRTSGATSVTLEGSTVTMANGYPTADAAGIVIAAGLDASETVAVTDRDSATAGAQPALIWVTGTKCAYFENGSPISTGTGAYTDTGSDGLTATDLCQ